MRHIKHEDGMRGAKHEDDEQPGWLTRQAGDMRHIKHEEGMRGAESWPGTPEEAASLSLSLSLMTLIISLSLSLSLLLPLPFLRIPRRRGPQITQGLIGPKRQAWLRESVARQLVRSLRPAHQQQPVDLNIPCRNKFLPSATNENAPGPRGECATPCKQERTS